MRTRKDRTAVVCDPYPLWLDALEPILRSIDVAVVGRTTSPERALELVEEMRPDILICGTETLDSGMSGSSLVRACRERVGTLRVVVLGASGDPADADALFSSGAAAYALKTAHPADVATTVRQAFERTIFLANERDENGGRAALAERDDDGTALTGREREILALAANGYTNRELARRLWVTEQTVKFHLSNVYRKLDVANRTEASRWAYRHGLVDPE